MSATEQVAQMFPTKANHVPEGWAVVPVGDCVDILDHMRVPVNSEKRKKRQGKIPYYGATGQIGWIDDYLFDEELLLLGEDGAPFLDKTKTIAYIITGKSWVNNHAHVLRALQRLASNHFLKFYFDTFDFADFVSGTTRLKLNQSAMKKIPVLIPPLAEQKRIVAKVEELLARVNATRERLTKVKEILKRFRQAVLAAACSGRLTSDWRDNQTNITPVEVSIQEILRLREKQWKLENTPDKIYRPPKSLKTDNLPAVPDSWRYVSSDALFSFVTSGSRGWAKYYAESGFTFIRIGNLDHDTIALDLSQIKHVNPPIGAERQRTRVQVGDILISITADVGMVALVPDGIGEAYVNQHVAISRPVEGVYRPFLAWTLSAQEGGQAQFQNLKRGATKIGLGLDDIRSIAIPFPPIEEQREIVGCVEILFKLADAIEKRVEMAKMQADKMTPAILAKAFHGELVPTEAELAQREGRSYEPASALLDKIKAQQKDIKPQRKRGRALQRRNNISGLTS